MPNKNIKKYKDTPISTADAAVIDMVLACVKNQGGRPIIYPDNEQGLQSFNDNTVEFFEYLNTVNTRLTLEGDKGLIPDIELWCSYLGVSRATLHRLYDRGGVWSDRIDYYKNLIAAAKKELMLRGSIPAIVGVFDLANNHGYKNTSEFKLTADIKAKSEDAIAAYQLPDLESESTQLNALEDNNGAALGMISAPNVGEPQGDNKSDWSDMM